LLEIERYRELQALLALSMPRLSMTKLANEYFGIVAKLMLSEPHFNYHINSRLRIYIAGKSIRKKRYNFVPKKVGINWGESNKMLEEIAELKDKDLLRRYKDGFITTKQFKEGLAPFLYNKDTNPDGIKWLVKLDKDFNYWVVLGKSLYCSTQEMLYAVVPTNNRHVHKPLDEYIHNDLKTVTKIIDDPYLGFADKVRGLSKVDNEYCLNTFYNDLQTN